MTARSAIVLLSGGLDSATTAAIALSEGFQLCALSVDYGQRHRFELDAARRVAQSLGIQDHLVVKIDLAQLTASALTGSMLSGSALPENAITGNTAVPKRRSDAEMAHGIPVTYVPARNTVLLSLALGLAEARQAADIFIGVNAVDYSGYPDCRPEFIAAFEQLSNLATKAGVEGTMRFTIHTPLITLSKAEIIRRGAGLKVDYGLTHTCYDPDAQGISCGECDACRLRRRGFADAGLIDPLVYAT